MLYWDNIMLLRIFDISIINSKLIIDFNIIINNLNKWSLYTCIHM